MLSESSTANAADLGDTALSEQSNRRGLEDDGLRGKLSQSRSFHRD